MHNLVIVCSTVMEMRDLDERRRWTVVAGAVVGGLALAITLTVLLSLHGVSFRVKPPWSGPYPASDQEIQQFIDKNRARLSEGSLLCPCGGYYFVDVDFHDSVPVSFYLISRTESGALTREVPLIGGNSYIYLTTRGYRGPFDPSLCSHVVVVQNATHLDLTNTYCMKLYDAIANYMGLHIRDMPFFNPRLFLNKIGRGIRETSMDTYNFFLPTMQPVDDQEKVLSFVHKMWNGMLAYPLTWSEADSEPQESDYYDSLHANENLYLEFAAQDSESGLASVPNSTFNGTVAFGMSVNWTEVYLSCGPAYCQDLDPKNPLMGLLTFSLFGAIFLFSFLVFLMLLYFITNVFMYK